MGKRTVYVLPVWMVKERCAQEHSGKLKVQQAESGKSRSLRRNVARLNTSVMRLEEDMEKLERVFPQACAGCTRFPTMNPHPGPQPAHHTMPCDNRHLLIQPLV